MMVCNKVFVAGCQPCCDVGSRVWSFWSRAMCYSRCEHSEGDETVSSCDVMTVSSMSTSEDAITNIQFWKTYQWFTELLLAQ